MNDTYIIYSINVGKQLGYKINQTFTYLAIGETRKWKQHGQERSQGTIHESPSLRPMHNTPHIHNHNLPKRNPLASQGRRLRQRHLKGAKRYCHRRHLPRDPGGPDNPQAEHIHGGIGPWLVLQRLAFLWFVIVSVERISKRNGLLSSYNGKIVLWYRSLNRAEVVGDFAGDIAKSIVYKLENNL